jgi:site-specific DNA-methyltransferase (adenine-specific)
MVRLLPFLVKLRPGFFAGSLQKRAVSRSLIPVLLDIDLRCDLINDPIAKVRKRSNGDRFDRLTQSAQQRERNLTVQLMQEMPYFEAPGFTLYHRDCLSILRQMDGASVDMVFADPPYFLSSGGITCRNGRMVSVRKADWDLTSGCEEDFEFHRTWIAAVRHVLKPNGTIWVSGTYHSIYKCGYALQLEGFRILNDIVWYKPNGSPNLSCRRFTASHESLIWAARTDRSKFTFNYAAMKDGDWSQDKLKQPHRQMRSVWAISTTGVNEKRMGHHPTQKPLQLLYRIVLACTNAGDLILDPFTGSSSTGLAATTFGRRFVGVDIDSTYLNLSIERYSSVVAKV